jgi:hypothetical protein
MSKMTKPQLTKLAKLEAAKEAATQTIYAAAAPRNDIRFNDCYAMASELARNAYDTAISELETFRYEMIAASRAYPGAFDMFTPNWR